MVGDSIIGIVSNIIHIKGREVFLDGSSKGKADIYGKMAYIAYYGTYIDTSWSAENTSKTLNAFRNNSKDFFSALGISDIEDTGGMAYNHIERKSETYLKSISGAKVNIPNQKPSFDGTYIPIQFTGGKGLYSREEYNNNYEDEHIYSYEDYAEEYNNGIFEFKAYKIVDGRESDEISLEVYSSNKTKLENSIKREGTYNIKLLSTDVSKVRIYIINKYKVYESRIILADLGSNQDLGLLHSDGLQEIKENAYIDIELGCDVEVKKETLEIGTNNWESVASTDEKKTAEIGDNVTFKITIENNSGRTINMNITDTFDSDYYEYVSVSGWNWTKENEGKYSRNVSVGTSGLTCYIKLKLKSNLILTADNKYINNVTISNFKNKSTDIKVLKNKEGNKVTDSDYAKLKTYKATINKYIYGITDQTISGRATSKETKLYSEPGDIVKFAIKISNTGTDSNKHGNIKKISFEDIWTNGDYVEEIKYSSSSNENFNESMPTNWSKSGNEITYAGTIQPGETKTLYVKCKVKKSQENTQVKNEATITTIKNKNGVDIYTDSVNYMESITNSSKDFFIIKRYLLDISKTIYSVTDVNNKGRNTDTVEIGDKIKYKIEITNTGNSVNEYGKIKEVNLTDTYPSEYLKYISFNKNGEGSWIVEENGKKIKYTNEAGLGIGQTATLYFTFEVIKPTTALENNVNIVNKIEIKPEHKVLNKNDVDILDWDLSSEATTKLLAYRLELNKYIKAVNNKTIEGSRKNKTNTEKYDNPVVIEKGDKVSYNLTVHNKGDSSVEDIAIKDTAESGLKFIEAEFDGEKIKRNLEESKNNTQIVFSDFELGSKKQIDIQLTFEVTKTNLYLPNLKNAIELTSAKNRNDVDILNKKIINTEKDKCEDYVRLKELDIAGTVWEDANRDGLMEKNEPKVSGIKVNLYKKGGTFVKSTETDVNGKYKFAKVTKGTNKDAKTGNYNNTSVLIDYYLEFEYNGTQYKSTKYASDKNINSDGSYKEEYKTDSNVAEFEIDRKTFNSKYQTISYNNAKGTDGTNTELSYEQEGNISKIKKQNTIMKARSFAIKTGSEVDGIKDEEIKFLWLYSDGETDYLNYINLGLIPENFDLSINQSVSTIKTTINGEETVYNYKDIKNDYKFEIYQSDYYYKPSEYYTNQDIIDHKANTELDVEITYNVKITNERCCNSCKKTCSGNCCEYCCEKNKDKRYAIINEIVDYYSEDFVNLAKDIKQIKIKDSEGVLQTQNKKVIKASDGIILNNTQKFGNKNTITGYNTLYVTGLEEIRIGKGESLEYDITFTIKVNSEDIGHLILGEKNNIVEINAYSTYEQDGSAAGLIDKDSNPGSIRNATQVVNYEDDTKILGIDVSLYNIEENRKISGTVWNDARSEDVEGQYLGNGQNTLDRKIDKKHVKAESNIKIDETYDIPVKDMKVELVEQVRIRQSDGKIRIYEEKLKPWSAELASSRTDRNGKYNLKGFIPGEYVTRFTYGDLNSESMLIYNGQDYKSTAYYEGLNTTAGLSDEEVLRQLELSNSSDARDDEIRRLEVNSYAEIINNEKNSLLNQISGNTEEFINKTQMYAETIPYRIKGERIASNSIVNIVNRANYRYNIKNVDFGIEYRPETNIKLNKYLSNIEVILSSGEKLFDIKYKNVYKNGNSNETIINTVIDEKNSIGIEQYQFLPTIGNIKGFGYLNTDVDLLQGSTIKIKYIFAVNNTSEIDRIGEELYSLRDKQNAIDAGYEQYIEERYTAAGTARNKLYKEYYNSDANGRIYRTKEKEYYGTYLGETYYTGKLGENDKVSEIKINKILDYIDTDLTFHQGENEGENSLWKVVESNELYENGYIDKEIFRDRKLVDVNGISFDTENTNNLVVSVDDGGVKNIELSKYLKPEIGAANDYFATISLLTSKVVASEDGTNNMTFDNTAEVIEYTSESGRITSLEVTIGNADMKQGKNMEEKDTDITETVLLIPPTGKYTIKYYISRDKNIIFSTIIVIIVALSVSILIKQNKISFKKRYK